MGERAGFQLSEVNLSHFQGYSIDREVLAVVQGTPQGLAQRAQVVQLAAQGMGVRAIGGRVGMHYNQVAKWRRRYLRGGIGALQDEPRSGRKGNLSTELLRQIVDQATRPPQGRVRWTCRAMAREFGVSKASSNAGENLRSIPWRRTMPWKRSLRLPITHRSILFVELVLGLSVRAGQ